MPAPVEFTITISSLPVGWTGDPQDLLDALETRLTITPSEPWSSFINGGAQPTSDVGPWLKLGQQWKVWDVGLGTYIDHVQDGAGIVNGTITAAKLAAGAIDTAAIADGSITAAKLASDAVTTIKILDANVTAAKLASDAVTTIKILDANVTAAKLASDAVTTIKILDANVTAAKLASNSVTTVKILDANVTLAKLANGTAKGVLTYNGSGVPTVTAAGTDGWVLTQTASGPAMAAIPAATAPVFYPFRAIKSAASQAVVFGGAGNMTAQITFDSEVIDPTGVFATNSFTVPTAKGGAWLIGASVEVAVTSGSPTQTDFALEILVNGGVETSQIIPITATAVRIYNLTSLLLLAAGDVVTTRFNGTVDAACTVTIANDSDTNIWGQLTQVI